MKENILKVDTCAGCMVCQQVCPKECIEIKFDELGHTYPKVKENDCISCAKCLKTCPEYTPVQHYNNKNVYAVWANNNSERQTSTSGGIASVLSRYIIENDGVVFGAAFEPPFSVNHIEIDCLADVDKLKGSKYVQSDTSVCWSTFKKEIKSGRKVLFVGTPCQTAAAIKLAGGVENLLTVDLVCHGVPSLAMLKSTIPQDVINMGISNLVFREKAKYHFSILRERQVVYERTLNKDWYYKAFFGGLICRESCLHCKYAQFQRVTDLTIGDFWGLKQEEPNVDIRKGVSMMIVNTEKGAEVLRAVSDRVTMKEKTMEEAMKDNDQLKAPIKISKLKRRIFKFLYPKYGLGPAFACSSPAVFIKNMIIR